MARGGLRRRSDGTVPSEGNRSAEPVDGSDPDATARMATLDPDAGARRRDRGRRHAVGGAPRRDGRAAPGVAARRLLGRRALGRRAGRPLPVRLPHAELHRRLRPHRRGHLQPVPAGHAGGDRHRPGRRGIASDAAARRLRRAHRSRTTLRRGRQRTRRPGTRPVRRPQHSARPQRPERGRGGAIATQSGRGVRRRSTPSGSARSTTASTPTSNGCTTTAPTAVSRTAPAPGRRAAGPTAGSCWTASAPVTS